METEDKKQEIIFNDGFVEPKIDETHYVEGDGRLLGAVDLKADGDWRKFDVTDEIQSVNNQDTFGCTAFGAIQQIAKMINFIYGEKPNFSERFLYNLVEINPPGADPQKVYEAVRKVGLVKQEDLPVPKTLEEFRRPRPMTDTLKDKAKKVFKDIFYFDHDWVLTGKPDPEKLRANLRKSPLAVSVTAWLEENGVYVDGGQPNTHWTGLDYMDNDYYYIDDSYPPYKKKLPIKRHNINYAKRIVLYKKDKNIINNSLLEVLRGMLKLLTTYVAYIKKTAGAAGEIFLGVFNKRN